jgi:hypothetical protein
MKIVIQEHPYVDSSRMTLLERIYGLADKPRFMKKWGFLF